MESEKIEEIEKKRNPLCFVEVIDRPLSIGSEEIERWVNGAYAAIQEACEHGGLIPLSTQQTVHTYTKHDGLNRHEHIVFVLTVHIVTGEELQKRQRLAELGGGAGNRNGPRRG